MRAKYRVLITATMLAALGTLGLAYSAHAVPPPSGATFTSSNTLLGTATPRCGGAMPGTAPRSTAPRRVRSLTARPPSAPPFLPRLAAAGST
jgi:hypothetical protein